MSILHRPDMPVLTLHQPWATLIAEGQKWIETRPNRTHVRGRVAIHAAVRAPGAQDRDVTNPIEVGAWQVRWAALDRVWVIVDPPGRKSLLPFGCIVATAAATGRSAS